jgi:hypothetical protein
MENGTLIEFRVTEALKNDLAEFIADHCQLPRAQAATFASQQMIGLHLGECRAKTARAIGGLFAILQRHGVRVMDAAIVGRVEALRLHVKEAGHE